MKQLDKKILEKSVQKTRSLAIYIQAPQSIMLISFFFSSRRRHTRLVSDWSSDVCSSDIRRRHTRLVSDWSSDVCSSDLMRRHTRLVSDWSSDVCSSDRSEEHTSELQSLTNLVCRLLLRSEERRVGE